MKILADNRNIYNKQSQYNINCTSFSGRNFKGNPADLESMAKKAKNIAKEIGYTIEDVGDNLSDNIKEVEKKANGLREKLPSWMPLSKKPKPPKVKRNEYIELSRPPKQKPPIKEEPPAVPPKPKFELPKPEFKFNETNPVEFAKEKDAYMRKIIPYADTDEKTALEVMAHFDKYGSNELLMNLLTSVRCIANKTENIANRYLQLYDNFTKGEPDIEKILTSPLSAIIEDYGNVLSKDSIKLIIKGFKKAGNHPGDLMDVSGFMKGDKYSHPFLSKFNSADLDEIDKLAQDAEEVVRKRVYKD
jgi:hypothetical protein